MKQTLTRDVFIHNLKSKDRSDNTHHNIMILGHAVFDLHDAVKELLERTKDLYHLTVIATSKGKSEIKMAPENYATAGGTTLLKIDKPGTTNKLDPVEDEGVESF